jgi:hypothetical protein
MFNNEILVRQTGGPVTFYDNYTTTNLYVERTFGSNNVHSITVSNDSSTDAIQLSWDGATLVGEILAGENMTVHSHSHQSVYIKGTAGGGGVRIWGW